MDRLLHRTKSKRRPLAVSLEDPLKFDPENAYKSLHIFQSKHEDALEITFHRTLRIPDDRERYERFPPGYGALPIYNTDQFCAELPVGAGRDGGCFVPLYEREALYITFNTNRPFTVKIFYNNVNVITGHAKPPATDKVLHLHPTGHWLPQKRWITSSSGMQDYVMPPRQLWIDGLATKKGILQFVTHPDQKVVDPSFELASAAPKIPVLEFASIGEVAQDAKKDAAKNEPKEEIQTLRIEAVPLLPKDIWIYLCFPCPRLLLDRIRIEVRFTDHVYNTIRNLLVNMGQADMDEINMVSCWGQEVGGFKDFGDLGLENGDSVYVYFNPLVGKDAANCLSTYVGARQTVFRDLWRSDDWDESAKVGFDVKLLPIKLFKSSLPKLPVPLSPISKSTYGTMGVEWRDVYAEADGTTGDEVQNIIADENAVQTPPSKNVPGEVDGNWDNGDEEKDTPKSKKDFHKSDSVRDFLKEVERTKEKKEGRDNESEKKTSKSEGSWGKRSLRNLSWG